MNRITIPTKPGAEISYTLYSTPSKSTIQPSSPRLIVFLNNLLMPASSWSTPITLLNSSRTSTVPTQSHPIRILTYDRYGQGATTARDPLDYRPGIDPAYGHDFSDVIHDLHELITSIMATHFPSSTNATPDLFLVGASIGAPLARLYAAAYPRTVSAVLLLDSNVANREYSSFWPDASSPDFDPAEVIADDCTLEQYIAATAALSALFDSSVKNNEGLDRRNLKSLLPRADAPVLYGPDGKRTKVCVVGHDKEFFAREGLERMGTPISITSRWTQPAWDEYNHRLLEIGDVSVSPKVVYAKRCGHFIQRDDPKFVAEMIGKMLDELGW